MHRFDTHRLGKLIYLCQYGPVFLSNEEYEKHLKQVLKGHYRFLARSVFALRDREFWNYHKDGLEKLGYHLSPVKFTEALFLELLNLRSCIARVRQALKQRKNQDLQHRDAFLSSIYTQESTAK
jgi:hypothetical protein